MKDTIISDISEYLKAKKVEIEAALDRYLPADDAPPSELHSAVRYAVFAGGKRLRPTLCLAAAEAFGVKQEMALLPAAAIEMLHTASLIHDDLPCMDDDDFRRGQPTCHKIYGEAVALLAGDWLMTYPFLLISDWEGDAAPPAKVRLAIIRELALAIGSQGMIAGQVLDLRGLSQTPSLGDLVELDARKTGALIAASVRVGGILGGAAEEELELLSQYGRKLGLAFQITDDLLDVTSTFEEMGKTTQKDEEKGKLTYPAISGVEQARQEALALCRSAQDDIRQLKFLSGRSVASANLGGVEVLHSLAELIVDRNN